MDNFFYHVPTDIYFGKGQIEHLGARMAQLSKNVLLVYGGGSIKRSGLYDAVVGQLEGAGVSFVELSGVEPNPRITSVRRGVERGKIVVMTTQVPNEGSDLTVYHVGGRLKSTLRLLEAYDMTTESAVAKLMWILGQTRDFDEAERLFYRPVARDILCENES